MREKFNRYFEIFVFVWFCYFLLLPLFSSQQSKITKQTNIVESVADSIVIVDFDESEFISIDTVTYATYPYKISEEGKQFIKSHENLRLEAYDDPTPEKQSIGWGHQIQLGENYTVITKREADKIFENDIKKVEAAVNRLLSKTNPNFKYTQGFIDGMVSLVYNCGEYGVSTTDFYKRLLKCREDNSEDNINENDLNFTLAAVKTSKVFCKGHKIRRLNEYNMMIN